MSRPIRQFPLDLGYARQHFQEAVTDAVEHVLIDAERRAVRNATGAVLQRRTGRLARSIFHTVDTTGSRVTGTLGAGKGGVPYARIHEIGGVIEGRPWLVFQLPDGGWRKVRRVRIPKRPYLQPALEDALDQLDDALAAELRPLLSLDVR